MLSARDVEEALKERLLRGAYPASSPCRQSGRWPLNSAPARARPAGQCRNWPGRAG